MPGETVAALRAQLDEAVAKRDLLQEAAPEPAAPEAAPVVGQLRAKMEAKNRAQAREAGLERAPPAGLALAARVSAARHFHTCNVFPCRSTTSCSRSGLNLARSGPLLPSGTPHSVDMLSSL